MVCLPSYTLLPLCGISPQGETRNSEALSFCRPTELRRWQRNWIHRGAPRPANPVTCFPPGKVVAPATKGEYISTPAGRLYGFRRQRRYKKWRRRRRTSPVGTVSQPISRPFNGQAKGLLWLTWRSYAGPPQYFIPPEGGSPEPVREASAGPGQNPWRPGPKAQRRHQPSRP